MCNAPMEESERRGLDLSLTNTLYTYGVGAGYV